MAKKLTHEAKNESLAGRLLKRLPGGSFVQEQVDRVEHRLLGELKQRLDRLEQTPQSVSVVAVSVTAQQRHHHEGKSPKEILRSLLAESTEQSKEQSIVASCTAVLQSLVPDEARILAALSDGSGYAMINVLATSNLGLTAVPMLEYVSTVGRNAGVLTPALTSAYVRHLAFWGLTEMAAEDPAQKTNYEILETDDSVRKLLARILKSGERGRIVRRTLRMSDLGLAMWKLCEEDEAP
ncbi:MAG: Abi-alpha family protein [Stenotrophobium sp.]